LWSQSYEARCWHFASISWRYLVKRGTILGSPICSPASVEPLYPP
jgi:hypothetical protein